MPRHIVDDIVRHWTLVNNRLQYSLLMLSVNTMVHICLTSWLSFCTTECPDNTYGFNCTEVCNCLNGGTCDSLGCNCAVGFVGENCSIGMLLFVSVHT